MTQLKAGRRQMTNHMELMSWGWGPLQPQSHDNILQPTQQLSRCRLAAAPQPSNSPVADAAGARRVAGGWVKGNACARHDTGCPVGWRCCGSGARPGVARRADRLQHQPRVDRVRPQRAQRRHQPAGLPARRHLPSHRRVMPQVGGAIPGGCAPLGAWRARPACPPSGVSTHRNYVCR